MSNKSTPPGAVASTKSTIQTETNAKPNCNAIEEQLPHAGVATSEAGSCAGGERQQPRWVAEALKRVREALLEALAEFEDLDLDESEKCTAEPPPERVPFEDWEPEYFQILQEEECRQDHVGESDLEGGAL